ncbi:MAG: YitT family protein [Desulfovibrionales bacterium]|nr:MAG: YitT family protein [Desulfovibrionales bacterium]
MAGTWVQQFRIATYSISWNLLLITTGALVFAFGVKAVVIPQEFISGGMTGVGLLLSYVVGVLPPGGWLLLLNIPIFILGWICVSRRFFCYSLYGMLLLSLGIDTMPWALQIEDTLLAALTAGAIMGAGSGIALRSMGSLGGLDVISVFLNQRFNLGIGKFSFGFNLALFTVSLFFIGLEHMLYSVFLVFVHAMVMDYFLGMFNQRKMVLVVTEKPDDLAKAILSTINRGSTFLYGRGAYTGKRKKILLTVVNSIQLKRLEEVIFTVDPQAFTIEENTLNVIGQGFSRRKIY